MSSHSTRFTSPTMYIGATLVTTTCFETHNLYEMDKTAAAAAVIAVTV